MAFYFFHALLYKKGTKQIDTTIPEGRGRCYRLLWQIDHLLFTSCSLETMTNKTLGNEMSHNWVCDELPSSFNVMPLPGLTTFLWALQTVASTMKLFFRRIITGCLKSSVNSCLPSLSTMQISPSLSRKESRQYRALYFLISDFFTFVIWRSVLESARWNFCKAPISLGYAPLRTSLRTVFSALSSCSIRGVTSTWVMSTLLVPEPVMLCLGLRGSIQEIDLFSWYHLENRVSLARKSLFSSMLVLCTKIFLISGFSMEISSRSKGSQGHLVSGSHKKFEFVIQQHCRYNSWPSRPCEASSAGFLLDPTYLHWWGFVVSCIIWTQLATKTWKRFFSLRMCLSTVVLSPR